MRMFSAVCCFSSLFQGGANPRNAGQLQSGPEAPIWATRGPCDLDMSPEATCRRMSLLSVKKPVNFGFPRRQSLNDYPPFFQVKPSTAACKSTSYYISLRRLRYHSSTTSSYFDIPACRQFELLCIFYLLRRIRLIYVSNCT